MDLSLEKLLHGLASPEPTPSGGAAAALALAEAQALGLKVVRISARFTRLEPLMMADRELTRLLDETRPKLQEDCEAVASRHEQVEPLIRVPLDVLRLARATLECLSSVFEDVKPSVLSDAAAAASLARAAAEISYWNVRNNVSWGTERERWGDELEAAARHHAAVVRAFETLSKRTERLLG